MKNRGSLVRVEGRSSARGPRISLPVSANMSKVSYCENEPLCGSVLSEML
jgi:hypothetical protein